MNVTKQADAGCDRENLKSKSNLPEKLCRANIHLVFRTYVHKYVKTLMKETNYNVDDLVINLADYTEVGALETF